MKIEYTTNPGASFSLHASWTNPEELESVREWLNLTLKRDFNVERSPVTPRERNLAHLAQRVLALAHGFASLVAPLDQAEERPIRQAVSEFAVDVLRAVRDFAGDATTPDSAADATHTPLLCRNGMDPLPSAIELARQVAEIFNSTPLHRAGDLEEKLQPFICWSKRDDRAERRKAQAQAIRWAAKRVLTENTRAYMDEIADHVERGEMIVP